MCYLTMVFYYRPSVFLINVALVIHVLEPKHRNGTCRPANLENVFRGTFRVKKRDLPAKSGTVGRAHIEIFFKKYTAYRNQLRSKIHCSTAIRPRYLMYFCEKSNRISVITFNWVICINVGVGSVTN